MKLDRDSIHRRAIRLGAVACLAAVAEASQVADLAWPALDRIEVHGPLFGLAALSFGLGALMFRAVRHSGLCTR
jgi:hypothetical protein